MSDDATPAKGRIDDAQRTHWDGCERDHRECLIQRMADEIERLRATLDRQQISYEREREIDQEEIERLRAQRRGDANALRMIADALGVPEDARHDGGIMRAITKLADAEVLATYGSGAAVAAERERWLNHEVDILAAYSRTDGRREWVSVGTWLRRGEVVALMADPRHNAGGEP